MTFNSLPFLQFFAAFLLLFYWVRHRLDRRNLLVVAGSCFFYGWWDYRFVGLLLLTAAVDFWVARRLQAIRRPGRRLLLLWLSIVANLGVLGLFKYCNFFVESLARVTLSLGIPLSVPHLAIILPVGISFYTFQSMSYSIDVYRGEIPACDRFVDFLAFVSFFPQLVAGPIERAGSLLTQIQSPRVINLGMIREGWWLILWGLFKKVVVADNLAPLVELAWAPGHESGAVVFLGLVAFGLQIYCDFSGYSDIARGCARWLGFDLMVNFNLPYFAGSIREFWRRWHISLSTWLRDYLYRPLGGNRGGSARTLANLALTMILGGLWHGAAWNFVVWGLWHGAGLILHRLWCERAARPNGHSGARWAALHRIGCWLATQLFVLYGWLVFRSGSMEEACRLTLTLGSAALPVWLGDFALSLVLFAAPVVAIQLWQRRTGDLLCPVRLGRWPLALLEAALLAAIILYWNRESPPFIYFQF